MKNASQIYKRTSVQSASPEKLLLLLYEGAIRFVKLAMLACDEKNIAQRGYNIGRAFDIILELNNTLDHKIGGDVAKNLEQLYVYMTDQLTAANVTGDKQNLENTLRILEKLYEGWKGAVEKIKTEGQV